jgi:CDP-glucose 4,6-dehydratase
MESVGANVKGLESFRGRSVFITGHTGFKGSWLTLWLHHLGARVSGYSLLPPTNPSNFATSCVRELLARHSNADVRDTAQLQGAIEACRPTVIFHFAAQTLVRQSYLDARQTFDVNVMGTASLLEAVRRLRLPCVVIVVTSDKCYENHEPGRRHRETDPLGGSDPYSASKAATEILTESFRQSFFRPDELREHGVQVASVRAGNAIGGGDWARDRIIPDMVKAAVANTPVQIRNPRSIRPWQHVLEPLSGYLSLAGRMLGSDDPALCSGWNFGPPAAEGQTVKDLVDVFVQTWSGARWEDASGTIQPREQAALHLSIDKAKAELGWEPRWTFQEAVKRTARWYQQFYAAASRSTRGLCYQDISDYEAALANESDSLQSALEHAHKS